LNGFALYDIKQTRYDIYQYYNEYSIPFH
jgi:hypothetical protein